MQSLINLYLHDYGDALARSLSIKTGLPTYAMYDIAECTYSWGRNYFHYVVKVDDDYYLDAKGLSTEDELKIFWSTILDIPTMPIFPENIKIIKKSIPLPYTGDTCIDAELDRMGMGIDIPDHVKQYADILIDTYGL